MSQDKKVVLRYLHKLSTMDRGHLIDLIENHPLVSDVEEDEYGLIAWLRWPWTWGSGFGGSSPYVRTRENWKLLVRDIELATHPSQIGPDGVPGADLVKRYMSLGFSAQDATSIAYLLSRGRGHIVEKKRILGPLTRKDMAADYYFGWMDRNQRDKAMASIPSGKLDGPKVKTRIPRNTDVDLPTSYRRDSKFGEDREELIGANRVKRMLQLPLGYDSLQDIYLALLRFYVYGHIDLTAAKEYSKELLSLADRDDKDFIVFYGKAIL